MRPDDGQARETALDPGRSFIVQAPAGSGKTELLTRRFLVLLATAEAPEEVVAITFTRKAAGEMRGRILAALAAADGPEPEAGHARDLWQIAGRAAARDRERGWALCRQPGRLRVTTIDALCHALVRQMPVLSRMGAPAQPADDAGPLYQEAARRLVDRLEEAGTVGRQLERLLLHRDNRADEVAELIAALLPRREQWLHHLYDERHTRDELEAALQRLAVERMERCRQALAQCLDLTELGQVAGRAARWRRELILREEVAPGRGSDLGALEAVDGALPATVEALSQWQALAGLMLTTAGTPRRSLTKSEGFPAKGQGRDAAEKAALEAHKAQMLALLATLDERAVQALAFLARLPEPRLDERQWAILEALTTILPQATAELALLFAERGEVDHAEMTIAALRALGEPEAPTDLALSLDYRIRHLLVDEFQDTSLTHFALLERLVAGWQPDDGRTLFLVGDPMQSIYRFRQAEVGLFLQVRDHGVGQLRPQPLRLSVNFRSSADVVAWVNATFAGVLPAFDDPDEGAVSFSPSIPWHPAVGVPAVTVHAALEDDPTREAQAIVAQVRAALDAPEPGDVAILVRGRSHAAALLPALRQAGIACRAVEIERLGARPVVQDLLALCRALLHPADRVAWLALLRAPWCGLSLAALEQLARQGHASLSEALFDAATLARLDEADRRRIERLHDPIRAALERVRRIPLRRLVEGAWQQLGGPASLHDADDLDAAVLLFELLERLDEGGDLADFERLETEAGQLFTRPQAAAVARVQVLTMHKSKGLEFDTVILPRLGAGKPPPAVEALRWLERGHPGGRDLLLAPLAGKGEQDRLYQLLRQLERQRELHEEGRLLYVAATRARRRLHLFGHARPNADGDAKPTGGSLLERLWPVVGRDFAMLEPPVEPTATEAVVDPIPCYRLPLTWVPPAPPASINWPVTESAAETAPVEFTWAGSTARAVGVVVHARLQTIGQQGVAQWKCARVQGERPLYRHLLAAEGVAPAALDEAADIVVDTLCRLFDSPRGRWLFDPAHRDARCEYPLTGVVDGRIIRVVLDRTFIDNNGVRWIVDYKTGWHGGGALESFLDREVARYRAQLDGYAALMRQMDASRPIRLGLWFPRIDGWREWSG